MKPIVYLSGPITGLTYDQGQGWREHVTAKLATYGISGVSPLRAKEYLKQAGELQGSYEMHPLSTMAGIVTRDRWDCQRSAVAIVNVLEARQVSVGTVIELGWLDAHRIPIVLAMEPSGNVHEHSMVRGIAGFHVYTLEDAIQVTVGILRP